MKTKRLGQHGPEMSALGLGLMGMSDFYGGQDEREAIKVIHAALDAGITLLDTGDFYGMGANELLLARALDGSARRSKAFIQVKLGALRSPDGAFLGFDGRPQAVKTALAYTLKRLGTDYIDLHQPARVDPAVPIEETMGAIRDCIDRGWVRFAGLSEAGPETLKRAHGVYPITALQREYSLVSRDVEPEILPVLDELGAGLTAYGVLSRGLLSGQIRSLEGLSPSDYRRHLPRFQPDNLARNLALVDKLTRLAEARGYTAAQLSLAWVAARGPHIIPLVGTRSVRRLEQAIAALDFALDAELQRALEAHVPSSEVAGDRYDEMGMRLVE